MSRRNDLTAPEREALENTLRKRQATMEVLKGKQELTVGDFKKAAKSFAEANRFWPSKKLEMVLICMRYAPRVLQRVYQMRRT
jgi:hypothetical protein